MVPGPAGGENPDSGHDPRLQQKVVVDPIGSQELTEQFQEVGAKLSAANSNAQADQAYDELLATAKSVSSQGSGGRVSVRRIAGTWVYRLG
ncbi:hypothetical protein [Methylobacterium gnaphalii]|uniref:Uncharacterized protein n=1 Tax=Methylobacterium gnaphalii TaxID=1010610 RepID=A0A512JE08_9HYPH|nr:hypothetical protein [Methylobacterium gnaphalii]GEP08186.1 hypothetical protein MGN01_00310 [Methylobacterium gnaphalii]GLS51183.1 hypothetical protein GCM10007885_40370 [Methylobacterium gnaphalii]